MVEAQTSEKSDGLEIALVGYQMAISLWIHHSEQVWTRFNIMFAGHSILIAAISLLATSQNPPTLLALLATSLPCLGLVLCVLWFFLIRRGHEYAEYYTLSARELEERYLSPHVITVSRGGSLAEGKSVNLEIQGTPKTLHMSESACFEARRATCVMTWVFIVFYLIAFIYCIAIVVQSRP